MRLEFGGGTPPFGAGPATAFGTSIRGDWGGRFGFQIDATNNQICGSPILWNASGSMTDDVLQHTPHRVRLMLGLGYSFFGYSFDKGPSANAGVDYVYRPGSGFVAGARLRYMPTLWETFGFPEPRPNPLVHIMRASARLKWNFVEQLQPYLRVVLGTQLNDSPPGGFHISGRIGFQMRWGDNGDSSER